MNTYRIICREDVYWYYNDEKCKLEKETNLSTEDISKEVDWL